MAEKFIEQDLLAECKNGNRNAFEMLYTANQRRVFSVALNFFGGNRELAEDVTQQVFLKIFNKISDFRADSELTTWIYRMTVNACIDEQRKTRKFFSLETFFGEFRVKKTQDEKFETREISNEIQNAIGELKEKFRVPLLLKYSEDLSYEEIAKVLDCSVGTISSRLNRGHKMLAQKLKHLKGKV
ncbi:MAG TPA: sigma-70 family RNA polymerase sigma factor [Pyrinomonadaceae bacterium]|nr:sigma-70 family RNA polymerase sigma factor [Pyrinomonadaceae bacterium]